MRTLFWFVYIFLALLLLSRTSFCSSVGNRNGNGDANPIVYLVVLSCSSIESDANNETVPLFSLVGVNASSGVVLEDTISSLQLPQNFTDHLGKCSELMPQVTEIFGSFAGCSPIAQDTNQFFIDLTSLAIQQVNYSYFLSFDLQDDTNSKVIQFPFRKDFTPFIGSKFYYNSTEKTIMGVGEGKTGWAFQKIDFDVQNTSAFGNVILKKESSYSVVSDDFATVDLSTGDFWSLMGVDFTTLDLVQFDATTGKVKSSKKTDYNFLVASSYAQTASAVPAAAWNGASNLSCHYATLGMVNLTSADYSIRSCLEIQNSYWIHDVSFTGRWAGASSPPAYAAFGLAVADLDGTVHFHDGKLLEKQLKTLLKVDSADFLAIGEVMWSADS